MTDRRYYGHDERDEFILNAAFYAICVAVTVLVFKGWLT